MINSKEKEKNDQYSSHFAYKIDNVHKCRSIIIEQKLTDVVIQPAVTIHTMLNEKSILFRNYHPLMMVFVLVQFLQTLEDVIFAQVKYYPYDEDRHL